MPEKSKEDLEQIHEHNRRVLCDLLFDRANWWDTQYAVRLLIPFFKSPLQAADKLHSQMRSGALPWATRWIRLREGLPVSHMVTRYPEPADLDAVAPESLIQGMREISEGNNTVVRYWDFVGRQRFTEWLGTLAEHERLTAAASEPRPEGAAPADTRPGYKTIQAELRRQHPGKSKDGIKAAVKARLGLERDATHKDIAGTIDEQVWVKAGNPDREKMVGRALKDLR